MIDCGKSDNMIEICGKLEKVLKNEIKEQNITPFKLVLCVSFIQLSTYLYHIFI